MGTKNNPGHFDCYSNAHPDEPMFILLGRDKLAGSLVRLWANARKNMDESAAKVNEALSCADAIDAHCRSTGKEPVSVLALVPCDAMAEELRKRGWTAAQA